MIFSNDKWSAINNHWDFAMPGISHNKFRMSLKCYHCIRVNHTVRYQSSGSNQQSAHFDVLIRNCEMDFFCCDLIVYFFFKRSNSIMCLNENVSRMIAQLSPNVTLTRKLITSLDCNESIQSMYLAHAVEPRLAMGFGVFLRNNRKNFIRNQEKVNEISTILWCFWTNIRNMKIRSTSIQN